MSNVSVGNRVLRPGGLDRLPIFSEETSWAIEKILFSFLPCGNARLARFCASLGLYIKYCALVGSIKYRISPEETSWAVGKSPLLFLPWGNFHWNKFCASSALHFGYCVLVVSIDYRFFTEETSWAIGKFRFQLLPCGKRHWSIKTKENCLAVRHLWGSFVNSRHRRRTHIVTHHIRKYHCVIACIMTDGNAPMEISDRPWSRKRIIADESLSEPGGVGESSPVVYRGGRPDSLP